MRLQFLVSRPVYIPFALCVLKVYWRKWQEFLLQLPPQDLRDVLAAAFVVLQATCKDPDAAKRHWRNRVSDETWLLIKQHMSLRRAGWL